MPFMSRLKRACGTAHPMSGSKHTLKVSAVVAIGVDRHRVATTVPADASPRSPWSFPDGRQVAQAIHFGIIVTRWSGGRHGTVLGIKGGHAVECKDRLEAYLREKQVPFEVRHHPGAITAQEVAASEHGPWQNAGQDGDGLGRRQDKGACAAGSYHVDMDKAGKVVGGEVRLAHEEEFETRPDCEVGAMPPSETSTKYLST